MPKDTINKLTEAEARAEKIEKEARDQAKRIIEDAKKEADKIMKNADNSISEILSDASKAAKLKVEDLKRNTDTKLNQEIEFIQKKASTSADVILEIVKNELL